MSIATRLKAIEDRIQAAAQRAGRDARDVRLVAVSKTFDAATILEARAAGQRVFGENRAQELVAKYSQIGDEIEWHFVGTLQTNKVKHVVGIAALIHSVDSAKLAEAIAKRAASAGIEQDVLIEVNVAGDRAKSGVAPEDVASLVQELSEMAALSVRGLMTIPPWPEIAEDSRTHYKALASLGAEVGDVIAGPVELSMGMTRDFEVAIEEGATLIRVGEALFGPRDPRS